MGRILAIDFGEKKCGLAVTDPLKLIANGLTTVPTVELWGFIERYFDTEDVEGVVLGLPKHLNNKNETIAVKVHGLKNKLTQKFPSIFVALEDERFTSKMAFQTMIDAGLKQKARRNKALVDQISATIILQSYLDKKK